MKYVTFILFGFFLFTHHVWAKHSIGFIAGKPTGVQGQLHLREDDFLFLSAARDFAQDTNEAVFNYLLRDRDNFQVKTIYFDLYYGGGIKIKDELGLNGSIGAAHLLENKKWEVFGQTIGNIYLFDGTRTELDLFVGARYLF